MTLYAKEDFPDPDTPVMTVRELWGMLTSIFLRLFSDALLIEEYLVSAS